jgi:hypothetical protein
MPKSREENRPYESAAELLARIRGEREEVANGSRKSRKRQKST